MRHRTAAGSYTSIPPPSNRRTGALVENDASFAVEGDYVAKDIPKNLSESHPIQIRDSDDAVQIFLDGYDGAGKARGTPECVWTDPLSRSL